MTTFNAQPSHPQATGTALSLATLQAFLRLSQGNFLCETLLLQQIGFREKQPYMDVKMTARNYLLLYAFVFGLS